MKNFESIKKAVEALNSEAISAISANERLTCELTKSEKFALVRFSDIAKAVNNKLSSMRLSVDVEQCKDDRLTLYYLVSNDESKSYIAKLYLNSVQRESCCAYVFVHSALLKKCKEHEELKQSVTTDNKALFAEYNDIAKVLKAIIALSKAE